MQNLDFGPLSRPSPAQPVEAVLALCNGDVDAAELIHGMWSVVDLWDDVVDRDYDAAETRGAATVFDCDYEVAETRAARVFQWMLFELPRNRLWRENATLHTSMRVAIANWQAANVLERSGEREQVITAYTLRCSPYDFFVAVVLAVAGTDDQKALQGRVDVGDQRVEPVCLAVHRGQVQRRLPTAVGRSPHRCKLCAPWGEIAKRA